ncbi:DUF2092 domain-containing protein [Pseudoxanthomonas koreensis]|uniref:DUF2092 domain-containing protein n=1 Tax=Pseudoxanthomonas koreensis TaxID=266061 RepID=UPI001EE4B05A|nr:DUF2092 domain-containing protein [Pseudoxanthomonas koreensis]
MALAVPAIAPAARAAAPAAPAAAGTEAAVDPAAVAALEKMGRALRGLGQFEVVSDASIELVLENGQKIEIDQDIRYRARTPDRLRVDMSNDSYDRQVFFDGRQLTVWAPQLNYYATVDTEARTLGQLVTNAASRYGLALPLTDLFLWGTEAAPLAAITTAFRVGDGIVDGDRVEHWAFRQEGADWQVWISKDSSLPRKLVIVGQDDPALPEFSAVLHWDTKTPITDATFAFAPPADANRIRLVPVHAALEGKED